jgi:hypothetical protein
VSTSTLLPFWRRIFGGSTGYVGLLSGARTGKRLTEVREAFYPYPHAAGNAEQWLIDQSSAGRDVYYCAHLLTDKRRVKACAAPLHALYVDGDGAIVPPHIPQPTITVETSPGRHQYYWLLSRAVEPGVGEDLNRRLAYAIGADKSGWDLTQLLRPPGFPNRKYPDAPIVGGAR